MPLRETISAAGTEADVVQDDEGRLAILKCIGAGTKEVLKGFVPQVVCRQIPVIIMVAKISFT